MRGIVRALGWMFIGAAAFYAALQILWLWISNSGGVQ